MPKTPDDTSHKRGKHVRVKTAKGRKSSSTRWLNRQLNDPYVTAAQEEGYRSRAAYKLQQLDDKYRFLKPSKKIVDLGAAPGSWLQVAAERTSKNTQLVGVDLKPIDALGNATLIEGDFCDPEIQEATLKALDGKADVIMSDMAASSTGHRATDHLRIIALCEAALDFALHTLAPGGTFLCKVLQGGTESTLLTHMKQHFSTVKHMKPKASRQDSAEMYVVAQGFRPPRD